MQFLLLQNYPNPFNPETNIKFDLPENSFVKIKVFDILGKLVTTLLDQRLNAGSYSVNWDASQYSSGVYFYSLETVSPGEVGKFIQTKRMILLK